MGNSSSNRNYNSQESEFIKSWNETDFEKAVEKFHEYYKLIRLNYILYNQDDKDWFTVPDAEAPSIFRRYLLPLGTAASTTIAFYVHPALLEEVQGVHTTAAAATGLIAVSAWLYLRGSPIETTENISQFSKQNHENESSLYTPPIEITTQPIAGETKNHGPSTTPSIESLIDPRIGGGPRRSTRIKKNKEAQEAEAERKAQEAEAERKAQEAEAKKKAQEAEAKKKAQEAEAKKKAEEEANQIIPDDKLFQPPTQASASSQDSVSSRDSVSQQEQINITELIREVEGDVSSIFEKITDFERFRGYIRRYTKKYKIGPEEGKKAVFKVLQSLILSKIKDFKSKSKKYKKFLDAKNKRKFQKNIKLQLKKVSSKNFVKKLMRFRTSQEQEQKEGDIDKEYDSYTEFFRNVFGHPKIDEHRMNKIRKLYLNKVNDSEQCNVVITGQDTRNTKKMKKINDYIETTKCYICGKPLKVRVGWEYAGSLVGKKGGYTPRSTGNIKLLWKEYGKHLGSLLPKCITNKIGTQKFKKFVDSAFGNDLTHFVNLVRGNVDREFGDDFKWHILKDILSCKALRPVKPGKDKRKKPACWFNFQSCLRPLECEHIFSIFTAMQHLWIVRDTGVRNPNPAVDEMNKAIRSEYEKTHRGCNRIKTDLSLIQFNRNGDIVLHEENVGFILNKICDNAIMQDEESYSEGYGMTNILTDYRENYSEEISRLGNKSKTHPFHNKLGNSRLSQFPFHFGGDPPQKQNDDGDRINTTNPIFNSDDSDSQRYGGGPFTWAQPLGNDGSKRKEWVGHRSSCIESLLQKGTLYNNVTCHENSAKELNQTYTLESKSRESKSQVETRYSGLLRIVQNNANLIKREIADNFNNAVTQHAIYMAWTKLKVLSSLSNVQFFELLTGTKIKTNVDTTSMRGGGKNDDDIIYESIHNPDIFNITKFEVFIHCFLALGDNENLPVHNPLICNYFDDEQRVLNNNEKIILDYSKIENIVDSEKCLKIAQIFNKYKLVNKYQDLMKEPDFVSPEVIATNLVNKSISIVPKNNVRDLISSFTSTGIPLQQAANETAATIKKIRSIAAESFGLNLSVQQAANVALNPTISSLLNPTVPNMRTGRNISELSMIPEEQTLRPLVDTAMPISVMGGKKKRKRSRKKRKKKKKRTRRRKK